VVSDLGIEATRARVDRNGAVRAPEACFPGVCTTRARTKRAVAVSANSSCNVNDLPEKDALLGAFLGISCRQRAQRTTAEEAQSGRSRSLRVCASITHGD
jgi:hypothetical protein